jgi:hypothetical protein
MADKTWDSFSLCVYLSVSLFPTVSLIERAVMGGGVVTLLRWTLARNCYRFYFGFRQK